MFFLLQMLPQNFFFNLFFYWKLQATFFGFLSFYLLKLKFLLVVYTPTLINHYLTQPKLFFLLIIVSAFLVLWHMYDLPNLPNQKPNCIHHIKNLKKSIQPKNEVPSTRCPIFIHNLTCNIFFQINKLFDVR